MARNAKRAAGLEPPKTRRHPLCRSAHVFHPHSRYAHDQMLRTTRESILEKAGYTVFSVETDDDAMKLLETEQFDLILLGRRSQIPRTGLDQRLREKYPNLLTLKIKSTGTLLVLFPTRTIDALPEHIEATAAKALPPGLPLHTTTEMDAGNLANAGFTPGKTSPPK